MNKLTRGGVAYNLKNSPYQEQIEYADGTAIKFVFSSNTYKIKFLAKCGENRKAIDESLSKRFGFTIKNEKIADLRLYQQIEKRGFLIFYDGVSVECLDNVKLYGNNLIIKKD